jgi:four helix bundle protein
MAKVQTHKDLEVYRKAFDVAMKIFEASKSFPKEETYSLTDQVRRSSRSVCANLAEAWRKRCYAASFKAKIVDAEAEAAETQVWLEFAVECNYITSEFSSSLDLMLHAIIATLVGMRTHPETWIIGGEQG